MEVNVLVREKSSLFGEKKIAENDDDDEDNKKEEGVAIFSL